MPRPKKPRNLKLIAGTLQKCRDSSAEVKLQPLQELPDAPEWLPNGHALKEWQRLTGLLHANGLLSAESLTPLAHLCALHGKLCQLWAAGMEPRGTLVAQYRALCGEFGLTPAGAMKVPAPGTQKPNNPFGSNGKKPR